MKFHTLICIRSSVFPIGIFDVSTPQNDFLFYFSSKGDCSPPNTWKSLVQITFGEIERIEKHASLLLKMRNMNIRWSVKNKYVIDVVLRVRSSRIKIYACHYAMSTLKSKVLLNFNTNKENLEFFVYTTWNLNTKKSFPITTFVVMTSGKWELNMCFTFLQVLKPPHKQYNLKYFFRKIIYAMNNNFFQMAKVPKTNNCQTYKY